MTIEIRSAPHIKGARTVEIIMRHVVWSLMPVCAFYIFQYGLSALASLVVVTASCLATERYFVRQGGQSGDISDFSAVITGILLALSIPPVLSRLRSARRCSAVSASMSSIRRWSAGLSYRRPFPRRSPPIRPPSCPDVFTSSFPLRWRCL